MAEFNLENFIANQQNHDFARGYVFYVTFQNPINTGQNGVYLVKSSSLPANQLGIAESNWQGNTYRIGTTNEYSDFTVEFNMDPSDGIRKDFLEWNRQVHDIETNAHGIPSEYMKTIKLEHLSHYDGSVILTYELHMAYPSNVGEVTLDYSAKEIATFSVTFTYQWHTTK